MDTRISVQFLGGVVGQLTGSCTLLTVRQGKRIINILIDCGLVQCGFKNSITINQEILFHLDPKLIDYIILTHAHVDHGGRIPLLVANGFAGRIICTPETSSLLRVMLEDTAKILALEARHLAKLARKRGKNYQTRPNNPDRMTQGSYDRRKRKGKYLKTQAPSYAPLYTMEDVEATCKLVKNGGFGYRKWIRLDKGIDLKFYPPGHVLGGAICVIKIKTQSGDVHLGFSGDLGREDGIILPPPEYPEEKIDWWVTEGTYGGEIHPLREEEIARLFNLVREAKKGNKKIIIPSFALERAQEIIYVITDNMRKGIIPPIIIYLNSPMAAKILNVFAACWRDGMFSDQASLDFNPFDPAENHYLRIVKNPTDSVKLIETPGPYIVIAGSGMCDAGRVREHLKNELGNKETIVCIVGYMANNSLGRKLKDGLQAVKMNGNIINVKAEIVSFNSLSAHADKDHLVSFAKFVMDGNSNERARIFIVHAEKEGADCLALELLQKLSGENWSNRIIIPKLGEEIILY
ncbi:MAG: MBL fold metallo-hydrolase [Patescibacteria group bacterium]